MKRFYSFGIVLCLYFQWAAIFFYATVATEGTEGVDRQRFMQDLFVKIAQRQIQEGRPFLANVHPRMMRGTYDCHVRFNFAGECWQKELRHQTGFFDNNAFVPTWISMLLAEAHYYGKGPEPTERQLTLALEFLEKCLDTSRGYNSSSLVGFYPFFYDVNTERVSMISLFEQGFNNMMYDLPQVLVDGFSGLVPVILQYLVASRRNPGQVRGCLKDVSEQTIVDEVAYSGFVQMQYYSARPVFPADTDDTFCWLSLGSVLKMAGNGSSVINGASKRWTQMNPNITSAFDALKKYAYRPFSSNPDENTIDTRSYYILRDFLWDAKESGKDVILVTTWFRSISEDTPFTAGMLYIPTMVNDVCLVVSTNIIHGITSSLLSGLVNPSILDDADVAKIYHNATVLIDYMVRGDFLQRPDLILFYYPQTIQFYFFLSRTLFLLENYKRQGTLPHSLMEDVYQILQNLMMDTITNNLVSTVKSEKLENLVIDKTEDANGSLHFFDDFIGAGDFTGNGETLIRGEDRIFSTSAAALALMNTWTFFDSHSKTLKWKEEAPIQIKSIVKGCINWLLIHVNDDGDEERHGNASFKNVDYFGDDSSFPQNEQYVNSDADIPKLSDYSHSKEQRWDSRNKGRYETWNAFFSSGRKGIHNFPFWYPANRFQYSNLSLMADDLSEVPKEKFFVAVSGMIAKGEYEKKLQELHFGRPTPRTWPSFNHPGWNSFCFWSSDSYTYTLVLLAISMLENIENIVE